MAIKKRSTGAIAAAKSVGLGAAYGRVLAVDVTASSDTSVALAVVDREGKVVASVASGNYTTKTRIHFALPVAGAAESDGTALVGTDSVAIPSVARSPLTVTPTIDTGTVTADFFVEV